MGFSSNNFKSSSGIGGKLRSFSNIDIMLSLGTKSEYIVAKKARGLLVQNKIKHTGFTKISYLDVIDLAYGAGLIAKKA